MFFESNPLILSKNLRQSLLIHNVMKKILKERSYLMNLCFHLLFVQISTHHITAATDDERPKMKKDAFWGKRLFFCRASLFIFVPSLRITALGTLKLQTQRTYTDGHKCAMLNILDHWLLAHSIMFGKTHTSSCLEGNFLRIMSGRTHCNLFGRTTKIAPSKMISTNYLVPKKEGWWWSQPPCSLSTSVG